MANSSARRDHGAGRPALRGVPFVGRVGKGRAVVGMRQQPGFRLAFEQEGLRQPQRVKDALLQVLGVALARDLLDDQAEQDIAGVAVVELAWFLGRKVALAGRGDALHQFLGREGARQHRLVRGAGWQSARRRRPRQNSRRDRSYGAAACRW